ncbi:6-phosphogluconate dehydrogenase [Mycobacterium sp. NAZ190054]|nr:NAD(P)-binding domain-containing protein [Mycobacterium sp. NAZ190054]KWX59430.1 6-phosphogluconate dehydrogenase [Mycobacterium sp. NAZ190054]
MKTVAVLGLGPMGRALAAALLDAGYRVTVWNRTESKAAELLSRGARWAPTPADAVASGDVTLINVVDHDAVDAVVTAAGDAAAGRALVGLSSDTPDRARGTAKLVADAGGCYLDGAIMTPTDVVGTADASVLYAGPRELFDAHRALFESLGQATWLGEDHGRAAAYDMALLDVFWTATGGFMHALETARPHGITPGELLPHALGIAAVLPPIFTEIAERVEAGRHGDASASVSSVAASLTHLIATSESSGVDATALKAMKRYADAVVAAGHGDAEISRLGEAMRG